MKREIASNGVEKVPLSRALRRREGGRGGGGGAAKTAVLFCRTFERAKDPQKIEIILFLSKNKKGTYKGLHHFFYFHYVLTESVLRNS